MIINLKNKFNKKFVIICYKHLNNFFFFIYIIRILIFLLRKILFKYLKINIKFEELFLIIIFSFFYFLKFFISFKGKINFSII